MIKRLFTGFLVVMTACVSEVNLPIRQVHPRLVVEGLITDEKPPYTVKLTFSGRYNSAYQLPEGLVVNGAQVLIRDDAGRSVQLQQDPLAPGYYLVQDSTFRGQPGHRYTLHIRLDDGRQYISAPELLPSVPAIDNLTAEYRPGANGLPVPAVYRVLLDTKDPATPGNFYRWSAYAYAPRWPAGVPTVTYGVDLYVCWAASYGPFTDVLSDGFINGNTISRHPVLDSPIYAIGRHYVEVRQYSMTRAAYQYWNLFEQQRTRTGTLFDAQPASIEGNVRNLTDTTELALGYFGASAVSRKRLVISGDTIRYVPFVLRYAGSFVAGDCQFPPPDSTLANWVRGK